MQAKPYGTAVQIPSRLAVDHAAVCVVVGLRENWLSEAKLRAAPDLSFKGARDTLGRIELLGPSAPLDYQINNGHNDNSDGDYHHPGLFHSEELYTD